MHNAVWGGGWCLPSSRQLFLELHMHSAAKIKWWTMVKMQKNIQLSWKQAFHLEAFAASLRASWIRLTLGFVLFDYH